MENHQDNQQDWVIKRTPTFPAFLDCLPWDLRAGITFHAFTPAKYFELEANDYRIGIHYKRRSRKPDRVGKTTFTLKNS